MVQRFATFARGLHREHQLVPHLRLALKVREGKRAEVVVERDVALIESIVDSFHAVCHRKFNYDYIILSHFAKVKARFQGLFKSRRVGPPWRALRVKLGRNRKWAPLHGRAGPLPKCASRPNRTGRRIAPSPR